MMVDNGVLDDVDVILGLHVDGDTNSGELGVAKGVFMASGRLLNIEIFGKSAHAASPHSGGIDALAIAVRMYEAIQLVLTREVNPKDSVVCSIGKLESGVAANIIPDYALMRGTLRTFDMKLSDFILGRIEKIAKGLMEETGAVIEVTTPKTCMPIYNNPYVAELLAESMKKVLGREVVISTGQAMGLEDFSWYVANVPGVFFPLGIRNEEKGIVKAAHNDDFDIDEDALEIGCRTFVQFVLDNQHGFDKEKAKEADDRK